MKYKVALLYCFSDDSQWQQVLKMNKSIEYCCIDITSHDWLQQCLSVDYQLFLVKAPGTTTSIKQLFDERIVVLSKMMGKHIYPSLQELLIYENKRLLAQWLTIQGIPTPQTQVFYSKTECLEFLCNTKFPIVGKINIGSSGKGVTILRDFEKANKYVNQIFNNGIRPYIGPNFRTSSIVSKIKKMISSKGLLAHKVKVYKSIYNEPQRYAILQGYVKHSFEWRVVVIGESYFAHKKIVSGSKASGSLLKGYDDPPLSLFDFVYDFCIKTDLSSTSIDLFETPSGYVVNEIQTFFGQSDPIQMRVGGIAGRYQRINGSWVFEEGDWAEYECYQLRLSHAISLLENRNDQ
ncbi:MAG: hypothetical protein CVU48_02590 [Candidatus Cloacimonetes bacterium HGW-Cloacimonetes-1]|jgi:glutathione synthase/RimK-type ligase-like ATP-grasp enzyme|nr:MAG: hypothetical protein CVU48_02590 [Candidatus Cloacimonetes bacterium HGW-Cloacimonetes-1]